MIIASKKGIIKQLVLISVFFIGTFALFVPTTHGSYAKRQNQHAQMTTANQLATFALLAEISTAIVEGFNIMNMGNTSAIGPFNAGVASATVHGISNILNLIYFPPNIWLILANLYFLSKDKQKIENHKALAAFYKQQRKHAITVKNKRPLQAVLLIIITLVKLGIYDMIPKATSTRSLLELFGGLFLCHVIDFFRKRARYNAELNEKFKVWLSTHSTEDDDEPEEDENAD